MVDDEEDFASALADRLNRRGFAAEAVFSGTAALSSLNRLRPDVIVLDLRMPGMDGLETLRRLRVSAPGVPVVVLTGHGTVAAGVEGMQLGAVDFLQKPVPIVRLCTALNAAATAAGRDDDPRRRDR